LIHEVGHYKRILYSSANNIFKNTPECIKESGKFLVDKVNFEIPEINFDKWDPMMKLVKCHSNMEECEEEIEVCPLSRYIRRKKFN
jgi:hypothetical protein